MSSEDSTASIGIPQLVACVVVGFILFRWVFSSPQSPTVTSASTSSSSTSYPGARRSRNVRPVTTDMIEVVQAMFPQVSAAAIRYDLERNGGNVETTTEKILAGGTLPNPPASQSSTASLAPSRSSENPSRQPSPNTLANTVRNTGGATAGTSSASGAKGVHSDLITRYNLQSRLHEFRPSSNTTAESVTGLTSKKNDRASLFLRGRERRDNMILEARKKMEERIAKSSSSL